MATPIAITGGDVTVAQADVSSTKSVTLTAARGVDSAGGTSIASFQWSIVSKPPGSSVAFTGGSDATSTPTLTSVDTWGNYLLLCKVTDTYGLSSASTYSAAPSSALVTIRVESTQLQLEKLATGERSWSDRYNKVVAAVESQEVSAASPTVASLTDTTVTGTQLNELVSGGGTTLHTHTGISIAAATTLASGSVTLAEAPLSASTPKAMTQARGSFSGHGRIVGGTPGTGSIVVSNAASNGVTAGTPDTLRITLPWSMPGPSTGVLRLVSGTGYPTVATSSDFDWVGGSGSDATQAVNIAGAINNSFRGIRAEVSGSTITMKATEGGVANNSIGVTYAASGSSIMAVTAFSGGSDTMDPNTPVLVFRSEEDVTLTSWVMSVSHAQHNVTMPFEIYKVSVTQYKDGSYPSGNKVGTIDCKHLTSVDDGKPNQVSSSFSPAVSVSANELLVVRAVGGTYTKDIDVFGQVFWRRRF